MDVDSIITWLRELPPIGVYGALFAVCYIENIFPPSPSDVLMLFIATLIGFGTISFVPAVIVATSGSVLGFLTAFWLGRRYGVRIIKSPWLPFLNESHIDKVERWFDKYGYWVIIINRFLAGTRAVISFAAGISRMESAKTTFYCTISALAWNIAIIELGSILGNNWKEGEKILSQYGIIISIILGVLIIVWLIRKFVLKKKESEEESA